MAVATKPWTSCSNLPAQTLDSPLILTSVMNDSQWKLSTDIESVPDVGCALIGKIREKLVELQWPDQDVFKIHLALEEAIMNAMKHGNRLDPNKRVTVHCDVSDKMVWLDIADEGNGFHREDVPDPTLDDNLEKETGRGLTIMENFMTSIEYLGSGNRVRMSKEKSAAS